MTPEARRPAPGGPGNPARWTSGAKDLVGCAIGTSRLWFTLGYGIVTEVYHPRIDIPQIRDLGFLVGDGAGFWVEVKRLHGRSLCLAEPGIPAPIVLHRHSRFTLRLRICCDTHRDVLLIEVELTGDPALRPYVLLAPHLGGTSGGNFAWATAHRGRRVLWAERGPFATALLASDQHQRDAFMRMSSGYVGETDGWQDFERHGRMRWEYAEAGPGHVALTGELPPYAVLALGFGSSKESAATLAAAALFRTFDDQLSAYTAGWQHWRSTCRRRTALPGLPQDLRQQYDISAAVLQSHFDRTYRGAAVASLSIPWSRPGDGVGGYHLVWPRDLVECAGALLALGADDQCRDVLGYLMATQNDDGGWHQNQWLGGKPYWTGVQLDEAGFPVLLAAALAERNALGSIDVTSMVSRALGFIALRGPASDQDRWEEDSGVNTFTLAVMIAALVCGARFLDEAAQAVILDLADFWNANVERWTSVRGTTLAQRFNVTGYFIRVADRKSLTEGREALRRVLPIKNRTDAGSTPAEEQIGTDFLQLVRFGLRRPDDPLVLGTLRVVDALLRTETPAGPVWHRYSGDGYGEHADGSPFDGTGIGRGWPLLTGERGHYELAAGRNPVPYLQAMCRMATPLGMLPEQVWDAEPEPRHWLEPGRPTGSATPLAWAHAEFIKLAASAVTGRIFDQPAAVLARYGGGPVPALRAFWSEAAPVTAIERGQGLTLVFRSAVCVRLTRNGGDAVREISSRPVNPGIQVVELSVRELDGARSIEFSWQAMDHDPEPGRDVVICIGEQPAAGI